eukprot:481927-Hanusia_phi.AAC.1
MALRGLIDPQQLLHAQAPSGRNMTHDHCNKEGRLRKEREKYETEQKEAALEEERKAKEAIERVRRRKNLRVLNDLDMTTNRNRRTISRCRRLLMTR